VIRFSPSTPITLLFAAILGVALWQTLDLGPVARFVPLAVVVPTLALVLFQLALDCFPRLARRFAALERSELIGVQGVREQVHPEHIPVREHPTPEDPAPAGDGDAQAFAWMGGALASAWLLGFTLGGPLFALAYVRFHGRRGWGVAAGLAAGLGLAVVGVFEGIFDAPLWRGALWAWLGL
jgi:hypothetical protein